MFGEGASPDGKTTHDLGNNFSSINTPTMYVLQPSLKQAPLTTASKIVSNQGKQASKQRINRCNISTCGTTCFSQHMHLNAHLLTCTYWSNPIATQRVTAWAPCLNASHTTVQTLTDTDVHTLHTCVRTHACVPIRTHKRRHHTHTHKHRHASMQLFDCSLPLCPCATWSGRCPTYHCSSTAPGCPHHMKLQPECALHRRAAADPTTFKGSRPIFRRTNNHAPAHQNQGNHTHTTQKAAKHSLTVSAPAQGGRQRAELPSTQPTCTHSHTAVSTSPLLTVRTQAAPHPRHCLAPVLARLPQQRCTADRIRCNHTRSSSSSAAAANSTDRQLQHSTTSSARTATVSVAAGVQQDTALANHSGCTHTCQGTMLQRQAWHSPSQKPGQLHGFCCVLVQTGALAACNPIPEPSQPGTEWGKDMDTILY